jgi:hypothetical protein
MCETLITHTKGTRQTCFSRTRLKENVWNKIKVTGNNFEVNDLFSESNMRMMK